MAWNEPGGDKNDPWKNRGGKEQGPPDLDEVLKNLFSKFSKSGGSGGGSGKSYTGLGLGLLVAIIVVIWGLSGFYTIKEAERGVILRFGENTGQLAQPGLSWKMTFIDEIIPVNVQNISSLGSAGSMLTEDENMVRVEMEMQYRIADPYLWRFSVVSPETSLSQALDSAIRYVVGHMKMDDILTDGRETARQRVRDELNSIVGAYNMGVSVIDMNFKDARPPQEVKAAFDDAIAAQEDEVRFIREAEAYAREIEPRARGQVNRMNEEAQAYKERSILEAQGEVARFEELLPQYLAAPTVTRQRIYLETMEQVFSSTTKIIVDTEGSGNMLYLPLDKIMDRTSSQTQAQRAQDRNTLEGLRNSPAAEELLNRTQDNNTRGNNRQGRN
ncbi:MAG: membrane protease subunit HflK [Bermanella sp.]|jgi:membrane protease subunit HflK|uniref:FtsH protease activity modulator HflK n=1 Tax=Glaciecola sp. 33A TaxID=2057807 RepID=UPI000C34F72D|nr:FtsH protease activity modulator HflK [Glaciecola sp. 33A]PKI02873.1 FtsH protease activity modulator HflK [Glaciecola sp. 33A]